MSDDIQPDILPPAPVNDVENVDPDDVLRYTQTVRRTVIQDLTKHGIPVADETRMGYLNDMLAGLDRVAISQKRIKVEEKTNDKALAIANAVVEGILRTPGVANLRKVEGGRVIDQVPTLDDRIVPAPELVPGETEVGALPDNLENFQRRMAAKEVSND